MGFFCYKCRCPQEVRRGCGDPLELELEAVWPNQMWVLGTELNPWRSASTPIAEPSRLLYRALKTKFLTRISELQSACTSNYIHLFTPFYVCKRVVFLFKALGRLERWHSLFLGGPSTHVLVHNHPYPQFQGIQCSLDLSSLALNREKKILYRRSTFSGKPWRYTLR